MSYATKFVLALFACLALSTLASAFCPHRDSRIKCCARTKAYYDDKKYVTKYKCLECDEGYEPIKNKKQCAPSQKCKKGTGPKTVGMGKGCVKCSDDNCADCHMVFYSCSVCKKNYLKNDEDGTCVPKLYG
jgi:hypothetical protein